MTQQEYENEIKELKERLEKLETTKIEEPQLKRWKPKNDEYYWAVCSDGEIVTVYYGDYGVDEWRYLTGNCFKTKSEAEEHKKQIEYTTRYKNYIEEHSEPLDWLEDRQEKWEAYFSFYKNSISTNYNLLEKHQGVIYASSKQIILDAIKEIGEDNFKKYVLGVK